MNTSSKTQTVTNSLLICGILALLCYAVMDILAGTQWLGYSFFSQAFSDYSGIGAPTRSLILLISPIYTALVVAFGLGVWQSARQKISLRIIGTLMVIYALVNWVWPQFYPIHLSVTEVSSSDVMHIVLTIVVVLCWLLALVFGAISSGKWFRFYSIGTLLIVIIFGALAGFISGATDSSSTIGLSAPWLGVVERINIYIFMVWMVVLAVGLLLRQRAVHRQSIGNSNIANLRSEKIAAK